MREATLRDFFSGTVSVNALAEEVEAAVEAVPGSRRRIHIEDLPPGEELTITPEMLVRLCDAALDGSIPMPALETISFAVIASDHLHWAEDDDIVCRVLCDWATPEVTWRLTMGNLRMFRGWLTGEVRPPSEPDLTTDTLAGRALLRSAKVRIR